MVCITILACVVCITVLGNNKVVENPLDGIVLEIKENTLTNTGLTLIIKNVAPNNYYVYGSPYLIEKKVNNNWEPLPIREGNYAWTDELRSVSKNSIKEEDLNWEWWLGELSPGNYRVTKEFAYLKPGDLLSNTEYCPISVEFTIDMGIRDGY